MNCAPLPDNLTYDRFTSFTIFHRKTRQGEGSHAMATAGIDKLHTNHISFGVISVISEAVPVFEFRRGVHDESSKLFGRYEAALDHFEQSRFDAAAECSGTPFAEYPNDGPTRLLLGRTLDAMVTGDHSAVWQAPGK